MPLRDPQVGQAIRRLVELGLTQGEEMTEQEELIQEQGTSRRDAKWSTAV